MKKHIFFILALLILFLQNAGAISSDFRDSYQPRETMIGKLSGEILQPINANQIKLKSRHIEISFDYGIKKIGNNYYIWLIAPQNSGNYTLLVENIVTRVNNQIGYADYQKDFSVTGNSIDYNVKPGAIFSSQNFIITSNLYENFNKIIDVNFPLQRQITLRPGQNIIEFPISAVNGTQFFTINFGRYQIPAYLIGQTQNTTNNTQNNQTNQTEFPQNQTETQNQTTQNQTETGQNQTNTQNQTGNRSSNITSPKKIIPKFKFEPELIRSTILKSEIPEYKFKIKNFGDEPISNIFLDYDAGIFEIFPSSATINPNQSLEFVLTLKNTTKIQIKDAIIAFSGETSEFMLLLIKFTTNNSEVLTEYIENSTGAELQYYCSELRGIFCSSGESCSGNSINTLDGLCCVSGKCEKPGEKGGSKAWIGYLIAGILIFLLLLIYMKYKKAKTNKNPIGSGSLNFFSLCFFCLFWEI